MVSSTYHSEFTSSIPPARLFKSLALDYHNIIPKVAPFVNSVEVVQGDGGVGTIKKIHFGEGGPFKCMKQRVDALDKGSFTYSHTVIEVEGGVKNDAIESVSQGFKIEPSANGGSIVKTFETYHTKGDSKISEEEIKAGKDKDAAIIKNAEAYLLANPGAYN